MKRLLLVSYFFSPEPSAGSLRAGALARWLPEHGWEIDLVTRTPPDRKPNGRAVVVPHRPWIDRLRMEFGVRPDLWFDAPPPEIAPGPPKNPAARAYGLVRRTLVQASTWPDRAWDWYPRARRALGQSLRERPPDAILTTSPPDAAHFLGAWAQRVTGAPWIADLRDGWADTHLMDRAGWRRRLDARTEREVLTRASLVTTVSETIAEPLARRHGASRVRLVRNGFDPELFPEAASPDRGSLTMLYTGAINPVRNDLAMFLDGAARFLEAEPASSLRLRIVGESSPRVRALVERAGLAARVSLEPRVPHREAVAAMRRAPALLFLPWQDAKNEGIYSAKVFEYVGARRPILAVGAIPGVSGGLVERAGSGRIARTPAEVAARLGELHAANASGRDPWVPDEREVRKHSHREMVATFARELDSLVVRFGA